MFFWRMFWKAEQQGAALCISAHNKKPRLQQEQKLLSCTFLARFRAHSPKGLESFINITETSFGPGSDLELRGVVIPEQTRNKKNK